MLNILYNGSMIQCAPLQTYVSALLFAPSSSITRQLFRKEEPQWVTIQPAVYKIWSPLVRTLAGYNGEVRAVAFSPDGKLVGSASDDKTVKLWDAGTGEVKQTLAGYSGEVSAVAFSPDGKLVGSASGDHTVKLWDAGTGEVVETVRGNSLIRTIQFDTVAPFLRTNVGYINFNIASPTIPIITKDVTTIHTTAEQQQEQQQYQQRYGLRADGSWITWDGWDVLWLPSEFEPSCSAASGSTIAIGSREGRVLLFKFTGKPL